MLIPQERPGILPSFLGAEKELAKLYLWPIVVIFLVGFVLRPLSERFQIWRWRRSNKIVYEDIRMRFSDQGIDVVRPKTSSHFDWSYFQSVIDHKELFLIVYGKNLFLTVPKRALLDGQISVLTEMLKSQIPQYDI